MQTLEAKLLYRAGLTLGEGPHWHAGWEKFLYVDIEGRKLGRIDPVTKISEEKTFEKRIGMVVPAANDQLVIAFEDALAAFDFEIGMTEEIIKIEADKPGNRCNDGKCDSAGRLWIGTMNMENKLHQGALYCFDGSLKKKLENVSLSNGICWSADNRTMYYIDSYDYNIKAYDFDLSKGEIANERVLINRFGKGFIPDGMTIDEEGMLWVAIWGGHSVQRYNPVNGLLIGEVAVPAPNVTSCAFGGKDMKTLLITTARADMDSKQLRQFPLSGSLFYIDTDVAGAGVHPFVPPRNK
jgi:sugar lactone lactonase YvrE